MSLSIMRQVERMRVRWPDFRVVVRNRRFACWKGTLRPLAQIYWIQISLLRIRHGGTRADEIREEVRVIDPLLRRRAENPQEQVPHVYSIPGDPERLRLCLYDPEKTEWHAGCVVANTIVPWTIDWLACYEGWLATGRWVGGGRHPDGTFDV